MQRRMQNVALAHDVTEVSVLDRLDLVPWAQLTHAYGPASDVPDRIRALRSSGSEARESALWHLYGNIFHQGTRYQATPHAVPFFYELIGDPTTPARDQIIYLLVHLALGYEAESHLLDGVKREEFIQKLEQADANLTPEERAHGEQYGCGPRVDLDCYLAVEQSVLTLIRLIDDADPAVRRAAVYAAAWFPRYASAALPQLWRRLESDRDEFEIANAVLAAFLLVRGGLPDDTELLRFEKFLEHPSPVVRTAAAIALGQEPLTGSVLAVLIEAVTSPMSFQGLREKIPFHEGNLAGYAALNLAHCGAGARDQIVPALCEALKHVNSYQSLRITESLLFLVLDDRANAFLDVPVDALTPWERMALCAIAEHGGWDLGNYCLLVSDYGLPLHQEELKNYLDMHGPGAS